MNLHQTPEDIIRNATPEQKILWNYIFLKYGERISISQLYFSGLLINAPITTLNLTFFYLIYYMILTSTTVASKATPAVVQIFSPAGANNLVLSNSSSYWNATAAAAESTYNTITANNLIMGRLTHTGLSFIHYVGYQIGY